jgi:hypothetical protein
MKKLLMAAAFAIAAPGAAFAAPIQICAGGGQVGGFRDVASGDTYLCELAFTGAAATNGSIVLDFESSSVPLTAAASAKLGGSGSTFTSATLEWFEFPSNMSLGRVDLQDIFGVGFSGSLNTVFTGPDTPDEQYVVLTWTGFDSASGDLQVSVQVAEVPVPVPVPAAGLLVLTAVGGLAIARRFKLKAA